MFWVGVACGFCATVLAELGFIIIVGSSVDKNKHS